MKPLALVVTIATLALAAAPAAAQGLGKSPRSGGATSSGSGVRQYGSWLDDASLLAPGGAWAGISFGHYRTPGARQTDFPVVDASIGLSRRAQIGITVPYYRVHFTDGSGLHGLGDVYFNGKFSIVDPDEGDRSFGLSASPVIELLDRTQTASGRFAWGIPVSLEYRGDGYRLFGSTGYFSRGAIFASTAVEVPVTDRLVLTGALSLMRSLTDDPAADALRIPRSRSDVTAVAAYFLTPSIALFGGTGRTISTLGASGTSFLLTGGFSVTFVAGVAP